MTCSGVDAWVSSLFLWSGLTLCVFSGEEGSQLMGGELGGWDLLSAERNGVAKCSVLALVNKGSGSSIVYPDVRHVYFWILKYP